MSDDKRSHEVEDILDTIEDRTEAADRLSVRDIVEAIGDRGFGPLIMIFALIEITPIGAIPGVPTLLAVIIALLAAQMVYGRRHTWLPDIAMRRTVTADRVKTATVKLRPVGAWLDRHFGHRLERLVGAGASRMAGIVIIALCATVPPLELLPWASSVPMAGIALLGLAIMLRDGAAMLVGLTLGVVAACVGVWLLL